MTTTENHHMNTDPDADDLVAHYQANPSEYTNDVLRDLYADGRPAERQAAAVELDRRITEKRAALADESKPSTALVPTGRVVTTIDVATGEHLDPNRLPLEALVEYLTGDLAVASPDDMADALERFDELRDLVAQAETEIRGVVVAALDRKGKRKAVIGGTEWETNAPTTEVYDLAGLRDRARDLVELDKLDPDTAAELIVTPEPKPQPPRVDKRTANNLAKSDDPAVAQMIQDARSVVPNRRTLKIIDRVPVAEAVDE